MHTKKKINERQSEQERKSERERDTNKMVERILEEGKSTDVNAGRVLIHY